MWLPFARTDARRAAKRQLTSRTRGRLVLPRAFVTPPGDSLPRPVTSLRRAVENLCRAVARLRRAAA